MKHVMTPAEFEAQMTYISTVYKGDPEMMHYEADKLMEDILIGLGYTDGVLVFNDMHKWYA